MGLFVPVNDSATSEVVGRKLNDHPILRQDADVVLPHLAADVGEDLVSVLQLNAEHRIGQRLDNTSSTSMAPSFFAISSAILACDCPQARLNPLSIRYGDDTPSPEVIVVHLPGPYAIAGAMTRKTGTRRAPTFHATPPGNQSKCTDPGTSAVAGVGRLPLHPPVDGIGGTPRSSPGRLGACSSFWCAPH